MENFNQHMQETYNMASTKDIVDVNVTNIKELITPNILHTLYPSNDTVKLFVKKNREEIQNILSGKDKRKIMIIGPCSIHDIEMAKEYGRELYKFVEKYSDKIKIVMRVYFEKPRTTVGWKGMINDPDMNNTFNINKGLKMARELLIYLNMIGVPCGYELLDTFTPQYIGDLISWGAIGARTTESQVHRQMVSGLSMPVGFKNNSSGDIEIAANAIISAAYPHCFYGIDTFGKASIVQTKGNRYSHIILRGSKYSTNYDERCVNDAKEIMLLKEIRPNIMIDCSHGNSCKDYRNQIDVIRYCREKLMKKRDFVMGFMIESNLREGKQKLVFGEADKLKWGVSITDSCVNLNTTRDMIELLYNIL
jgi:3-deoxy-7-phosphoheptulonate synthase